MGEHQEIIQGWWHGVICWECLPGVLTAIPNSSHWDHFHPVLILDICRVCSGRRHTNWPCSGLRTSAWPSVWQLRQLALLLVWPFTMNYVAVLPVTCPTVPHPAHEQDLCPVHHVCVLSPVPELPSPPPLDCACLSHGTVPAIWASAFPEEPCLLLCPGSTF